MALSPRRRGVTLLITLAVIAVMFTLIAVLFGYLKEARDKAESQAALIQSDLIRSDVQALLQKYLKRTPSKDLLSTLYATPLMVVEKKGPYSVTAQCQPLYDRIPLAWLGWDRDEKHRRHYRLALNLFNRLAEKAELKEPERLLAMISHALRGEHGSFGVPDDLKGRSLHMTLPLFKNLLEDYRFSADDPNVFRIDWSESFLIQTPDKVPERLDKDFLDPRTVAYLYDLDPAIVKEEYTPGNLDRFLLSLGEEGRRYDWLFARQPRASMHCELLYSFREGRYNVSFDYTEQRILNFELAKQ